MSTLAQSFAEGYACLSARADLLDRINVFPVADSDTGTNLRISLSPLHLPDDNRMLIAEQLVRGATGNSGNIAAAFFSQLLKADGVVDLAARAAEARDEAWQAVAAPQPGTMLSVFDSLAEVLRSTPVSCIGCPTILGALREAVLATTQLLPDLRAAKVVDAGALAMFVFFDGFFRCLTGFEEQAPSLFTLFPDRLAVAPGFDCLPTEAYCIDATLQPSADSSVTTETLARLGESVVVIPDQSRLKIHIHTANPQQLRSRLDQLGEVVGWSDELITTGQAAVSPPDNAGCLHIMTDAAGSLPRDLARQCNITLLDSYIVSDGQSRPESLCESAAIYTLMRQGNKVTTAQASLAERHCLYKSVCEQFGKTLYLAVGSAFTGNFATALAWRQKHDPDDLLEVIDTGAASGRLAVIALLASRLARQDVSADSFQAAVTRLIDTCCEYIFIDSLRYLAAGGRISRASGFFGDLLQMKPVISPTREGVCKVGVVRNQQAQLDFALEKAATEIFAPASALLLLQYSDNKSWVEEIAKPQLETLLPTAEILLVPLSLSAGVHMGPGTWALAFGEAT